MPFPSLLDSLSQLYPPKPHFTEKDVPSLRGKVYIVTGANTGIGKEVAQILFSKDAKIYAAARSEEKTLKAIESIKQAHPQSTGELIFLRLDLADLTTIKASAQQFLDKETKLHVLFHNAGVMYPPEGSKTVQGYELQLGVNNVGTFLFNKLLTPTLVATAKTEAPGTVRTVWVSSSAAESPGSPAGGVPLDNLDYHKNVGVFTQYCISKAGNYFQGVEMARRYKADGVVSVALNPGNLDSDLWRAQTKTIRMLLKRLWLHPVINGAYTEIFAGLSSDITPEKTGHWIVPWGRFMDIRKDLRAAAKTKEEGGTGAAQAFWEWNEEQVKPHL